MIDGAFKTCVNATPWKMDLLQRSLYYLFSGSPARRKGYSRITGSQVFPLQFCSTLWIEDVPVSERVVEIWTNICKHIEDLEKRSKKPTNASYGAGVRAVNDVFTLPKLHLFSAIAKCFTSFLEAFALRVHF